jgi:hypothetical protein
MTPIVDSVPELTPELGAQPQDHQLAAQHRQKLHAPASQRVALAPGEVVSCLHDHGIKDPPRVVAVTQQHVRKERHQVGAVVRQALGDEAVAGGRLLRRHDLANGGRDVPHEDRVDVRGQRARPRQPPHVVRGERRLPVGEVATVLLEAGQDTPQDLLVQLDLLGRLLPFPGRLEQAERQDPCDVPRVVVEPVQQLVLRQLHVPVPTRQLLLLPFFLSQFNDLFRLPSSNGTSTLCYGHPVRAGHRVEILNHPPLLIVDPRFHDEHDHDHHHHHNGDAVDDVYPVDRLLQTGAVVVLAKSSGDGVRHHHGEHEGRGQS